MGKRNYYFPPKRNDDTGIKINDDVKAELEKIAKEMADREMEARQAEDLNNYIAYTLEALSRLGWTGKIRLNRFLSMLTFVCEEATKSDDAPTYIQEIKNRMTEKGVSAFLKEGNAEGEEHEKE